MAFGSYARGALVRLSAVFTDVNGAAVDPTTVTVKTLAPTLVSGRPQGTVSSLVYGVDAAVKRSAAGHYYVDVSVDTTGIWRWRWESTGVGQAAAEGSFKVESFLVVP